MRGNTRHALFFQITYPLWQCWPEQSRKEEGRGYRFALSYTFIGIGQRLPNDLQGIFGAINDSFVGIREERGEQVVLIQQIKGMLTLTAHQQL